MAIDEGDSLSRIFAALADPTRRAILSRLAAGEADVTELMKPFNLSQPAISKHLTVLEKSGLVIRRQDAQRRPRALLAMPLKEVADWMEPFHHFWEKKFVGLDDYLKVITPQPTGKRRPRTKKSGEPR